MTAEEQVRGGVVDMRGGVPLLLSLIVNSELIWAALPLIPGASQFELADFPR